MLGSILVPTGRWCSEALETGNRKVWALRMGDEYTSPKQTEEVVRSEWMAGKWVLTRWQGWAGVKMVVPCVDVLHMVTRWQKDSAEKYVVNVCKGALIHSTEERISSQFLHLQSKNTSCSSSQQIQSKSKVWPGFQVRAYRGGQRQKTESKIQGQSPKPEPEPGNQNKTYRAASKQVSGWAGRQVQKHRDHRFYLGHIEGRMDLQWSGESQSDCHRINNIQDEEQMHKTRHQEDLLNLHPSDSQTSQKVERWTKLSHWF